MNGERFGGTQTVLDTMAALEQRRRGREQHEIKTVLGMAAVDPKGAVNAWNRSYLGMKYGRITYAGSKGEWVAYKDGAGKLYALNRSTGEFKDGIGEAAPEKTAGGGFTLGPGKVRYDVEGKEIVSVPAKPGKTAEQMANAELEDLMALRAKDADSFRVRLQADPHLKTVLKPQHWFWDWNQNEYVLSAKDLGKALLAKHKKLAGEKKPMVPAAKPEAAAPKPEAAPERQAAIKALEAADEPTTEANIVEAMRQLKEQ